MPARNTLAQLLAVNTNLESHNAQRHRQTDRQTDRRTDNKMIADHDVKSCFFGFSKKNVKNVTTYSHAAFSLITQLPEVGTVLVSHGHQHQTSCSEVWTQETSNYATENCV